MFEYKPEPQFKDPRNPAAFLGPAGAWQLVKAELGEDGCLGIFPEGIKPTSLKDTEWFIAFSSTLEQLTIGVGDDDLVDTICKLFPDGHWNYIK